MNVSTIYISKKIIKIYNTFFYKIMTIGELVSKLHIKPNPTSRYIVVGQL